jgi:hypothetical protein
MGREIRRVAKGWEHPRNDRGNYIPLLTQSFNAAAQEWLKKFNEAEDKITFLEEEQSPDSENRMPDWKDEEKTCWQMYETVSEGTPVTPVFETKEALVDYLVEHGTFWDQERGRNGQQKSPKWSREAAQRMVEDEWAPSGIIVNGKFFTPQEMDRDAIRGVKKP